jgi:hypothetical protein
LRAVTYAQDQLEVEKMRKIRALATFSDDGNTITGRWEIADDGTNYTTDFDLIYRRLDT